MTIIEFGHNTGRAGIVTYPCFFSGPVLPLKLKGFKMVQYGNEVIISGGAFVSSTGWNRSTAMYRLGCIAEGCTWQIMTTKLMYARDSHVSVVVPDNFVNCP